MHHTDRELCSDCAELKEYAYARLDKCPWGEGKPACFKCQIHCYTPEKRAMIRNVMRYSGPRMVFQKPIYFIEHYLR